MTRKDFELIANAIRNEREQWKGNHPDDLRTMTETLDNLAQSLGRKLMDANPRFDRERFLQACGVNAHMA